MNILNRLSISLVAGVLAVAMMAEIAAQPCNGDHDCNIGYYCESECRECYNCTRFNMQAIEPCTISITECGACLPGYVEAANKLDGCISPRNSPLPYWPALLAAAIAVLCVVLGFVARHVLRKKKSINAISSRPILSADQSNPTAPPPEESMPLNPVHYEDRSNGVRYQPTANGHFLEAQVDRPLRDATNTGSPPPYSIVLNELRNSLPATDTGARVNGDAYAPKFAQPNNGLSSGQRDQHDSDTGQTQNTRRYNETSYTEYNNNAGSEGEPLSSGTRELGQYGDITSSIRPSDDQPNVHMREFTNRGLPAKFHPKDRRVKEGIQRAKKFNNPNYVAEASETPPVDTTNPSAMNHTPEWLVDENTSPSEWTPNAPSSTVEPSQSARFADIDNSFSIGDRESRVRLPPPGTPEDEAPPRTRRRVAVEESTGMGVSSSSDMASAQAVALRTSGAQPSPGDNSPEEGRAAPPRAPRHLYNYNVIHIQPELSIVAKIDL